jgi:hypothetical protein
MEIPGWTTPPKAKDIEPARPMGWELLSKEDQDLSDRLSRGQQLQEWNSQTSALALNTARVVGILLFLVKGQELASIVHDWIVK